MDLLLIIGAVIFLGTLSGKIFQRFKLPQVTGYIFTGLLLGPSFLNLCDQEVIHILEPLTSLALGIIGFMLGAELKFSLFRKRGKSIYSILFAQGITTFIFVTTAVTLLTGKFHLAILLGAIATATDPASTVDVLWENKARGVLTSTLIAIVALDDILALIIYAFAIIIAEALILHEPFSIHFLLHAFFEIGFGAAIGITGGLILRYLIYFIKDRERVLPFSLAVIALIVGVSIHFKIDLILAAVISGITLSNLVPRESEEIFQAIKKFSVPILIAFFVLVGARLDVTVVFGAGIILLLVCVVFRALGKLAGSFFGGVIGQAQKAVTRYLGLALFPQAGVAIGMAISIGHSLSHFGAQAQEIRDLIINIAVATTFIFQVFGPLFVRLAIKKADEVGRDVTEDDIINELKTNDVVERDIPIIEENMPLKAMVDLIKASDAYHFCVVDKKRNLLGTISLGDLREVLLEQETHLNQLILSKDVAIPAPWVIPAQRPLKEAIEMFRRKAVDFLPVVLNEKNRQLVGIIRHREVMSTIQKELLRRRGTV